MVGINSDASVSASKGPARPINTERVRAAMLAASPEVDCVFVFEDKTPIPFLEEVRPHVHVNGAEYGKACIEAETVRKHGGRLHIVELLPGLSSSRIIGKAAGQ